MNIGSKVEPQWCTADLLLKCVGGLNKPFDFLSTLQWEGKHILFCYCTETDSGPSSGSSVILITHLWQYGNIVFVRDHTIGGDKSKTSKLKWLWSDGFIQESVHFRLINQELCEKRKTLYFLLYDKTVPPCIFSPCWGYGCTGTRSKSMK